jgi:hypothetical protein
MCGSVQHSSRCSHVSGCIILHREQFNFYNLSVKTSIWADSPPQPPRLLVGMIKSQKWIKFFVSTPSSEKMIKIY